MPWLTAPTKHRVTTCCTALRTTLRRCAALRNCAGIVALCALSLTGIQSVTASVDQPDDADLRRYAQTMLGPGFDAADFQTQLDNVSELPFEERKNRAYQWVADQQDYVATVRRGPYGVAHVTASDYGALGYGEAYAAAEDHLCNIALSLMQARGESAQFLGAGANNRNTALDAVLRGFDMQSQAKLALAAQDSEVVAWLAGYTAGYNRYLKEHAGSRNSSWCSGADWLREVSPLDFMTRMVMVAQTLPRMSAAIASVTPPTARTSTSLEVSEFQQLAALDAAELAGMGSNGWALGTDYTENGRGMLLANPHYPWYGDSRFWEKHLTIPGKLDIYGAHLLGSPGVSIGFNKALGWTHTVSASQRLVFYRLELDSTDPMRYRYGDEWKTIEERSVDIPVLGDDGGVTLDSHSIYMTEHGPIIAMPGMSWDEKYAYSVRDANVGNYSLLAQWKAMGEASNLDVFVAAHEKYNALPWVNTIAASADGRALYLDNSTVGHISARAQTQWKESLENDPLAAQLYATRGMILLNGSDPTNTWINDPDVPIAGTVPFAERPSIERRDYVFNANNSYWLSSPRQPLTGYSILYGSTDTARSVRTRMNVRMLENTYGDAGDDGRFNIHEIQEALFANRGLTAELLLPELTEVCRGGGSDLEPACDVLENYDGSVNLDSPGAVLFREWLTRYEGNDTRRAGALFSEPFDAQNPISTPARLGDMAIAMTALRGAIAVLDAARLPLNATLRETQFAWRGGEPIPVHGGMGIEGVANLQAPGNPSASPIAGINPSATADSRDLTDKGYPITHGSSFIYTLGFDDSGPVAEALLSYSQSGNPNSPHFRDQTTLYAQKQWRKVAFQENDIARNATSIRVLRSSDGR